MISNVQLTVSFALFSCRSLGSFQLFILYFYSTMKGIMISTYIVK